MLNNNYINRSYWETSEYFQRWDLITVGAGIVGLSTAIAFALKHPRASVLVIDRGVLPDGASTRNAGFACYGSPGELLADLSQMNDTAVWNTVRMRWDGLQLLRQRLGDDAMDFKKHGGTELFYDDQEFQQAEKELHFLNDNMAAITGEKNFFRSLESGKTGFPDVKGAIFTAHEGQINSGRMMKSLTVFARKLNITILAGLNANAVNDTGKHVVVETPVGEFTASKAVMATNAFAGELFPVQGLKPARAQVLITSEIPDLPFKGVYHAEKGFYYFRNINNRVLLGGARHLDLETEYSKEPKLNNHIQHALEQFLHEKILPGRAYRIEQRWCGIMGMGPEKMPIIKFASNHILLAVRMGGMGIAIGSRVGELAADMLGES